MTDEFVVQFEQIAHLTILEESHVGTSGNLLRLNIKTKFGSFEAIPANFKKMIEEGKQMYKNKEH